MPPSPGCVSFAEADALAHRGLNPAITRDQLERMFHVYGHRANVTATTSRIGGHQAYLYRACGYTFNQVQVSVIVERSNRPGFDRSKTPGERVVISFAWWVMAPGYSCGRACHPHSGVAARLLRIES